MRLKSLNMRIASKELPQSPLLQDDIASTHSHLGPVAKSPVEEPLRSMLGKLPSFMPTNGFAEGCRCRLALHTPNSTHQYIHLDTGEYGISSRPAADNTLVLTHIPKMTDGSFKNGQRKDEKHENMALPIRTGSFVRGHIEPYVLDRKIQVSRETSRWLDRFDASPKTHLLFEVTTRCISWWRTITTTHRIKKPHSLIFKKDIELNDLA